MVSGRARTLRFGMVGKEATFGPNLTGRIHIWVIYSGQITESTGGNLIRWLVCAQEMEDMLNVTPSMESRGINPAMNGAVFVEFLQV